MAAVGGVTGSPSRTHKHASKQQHSDTQVHDDLMKAAGQHRDKQSLAVALLSQGKAQAFIDFFLLTHQGSSDATGSTGSCSQGELPLESLEFLQAQTASAHDARRAGDVQAAFDAYRQLGRYFSQLDQLEKAASFYEHCLEVRGGRAGRRACQAQVPHCGAAWGSMRAAPCAQGRQ